MILNYLNFFDKMKSQNDKEMNFNFLYFFLIIFKYQKKFKTYNLFYQLILNHFHKGVRKAFRNGNLVKR